MLLLYVCVRAEVCARACDIFVLRLRLFSHLHTQPVLWKTCREKMKWTHERPVRGRKVVWGCEHERRPLLRSYIAQRKKKKKKPLAAKIVREDKG